MFIDPDKTRGKRRGFTLFEIMIAVAILGLMAMSIYRFVQTNITALRISAEVSASEQRYDGLRDLLTVQFQSLSAGVNSLSGEPLKLNDRSRDEIRWTTGGGPGLLTRYAPSDYLVTMRLQAEDKKSNRYDLGFLRKPKDDQSFTDVHESWIPLLENVQTVEVRYFDPRLNVWLDRWGDSVTLPRLVKITIGRADGSVPWEALIPLGRTPL